MGEAKRREMLGIPPRKKITDTKESDRFISWLPITKTRIKKYPYMGVATQGWRKINQFGHNNYLHKLCKTFKGRI